jgi:ATP-binding cassette subfamily C (CFTR/MRP) protein 1
LYSIALQAHPFVPRVQRNLTKFVEQCKGGKTHCKVSNYKKLCPVESGTHMIRELSSWSFSHISPLINLGNRRTIHFEDLTDKFYSIDALHLQQNSKTFTQKLINDLKSSTHEYWPLVRALDHTFRSYDITKGFWVILCTVLSAITPVAMRYSLELAENHESFSLGTYFILCLVLCIVHHCIRLIATACQEYRSILERQHGQRVRYCLSSSVYDKTLRINNASRQQYSTGEVINLMQSDIEQCSYISYYFFSLCESILMVFFSFYYLCNIVGFWSTSAGFSIIVFIMIPLNLFVQRKMSKFYEISSKMASKRFELITQMIASMRLIKLFAWENLFEKRISAVRTEQDNIKRDIRGYSGCVNFLWYSGSFLVAATTFLCFSVVTGHKMSIPLTFAAMSTIDMLTAPLYSIHSPWQS